MIENLQTSFRSYVFYFKILYIEVELWRFLLLHAFFSSPYHEPLNNEITFHIQEYHNIGITLVNLVLLQTLE